MTLLEQRLHALQKEVAQLNRLFDTFRGYVNRQFSSMHERFDAIEEKMATKEDLRGFATKDDLRGFATKDDLGKFATKDDLRNFAKKDDLRNFATKADLEEALEAALSEFETRILKAINSARGQPQGV